MCLEKKYLRKVSLFCYDSFTNIFKMQDKIILKIVSPTLGLLNFCLGWSQNV